MTSAKFDSESFKGFLGDPISDSGMDWGHEKRYFIDRRRFETYQELLASVIYHHHSSFDYAEEMRELGFSQIAQALQALRSGLPDQPETQMGNFAEVLGAEYGKWILNYDTTFAFPKRFNPNIEQSMKGVDILGVRSADQPSSLLIGEAKCYQAFDKRSVQASHSHLFSLWKQETYRLLAFSKEIAGLEGKNDMEATLDRTGSDSQKQTLALIINQNNPRDPFKPFDTLCREAPLPNLLAVHIQVEDLKRWMPIVFGAMVYDRKT